MVQTTYDIHRDKLREKMTECLSIAREMLDENICGYEEMKDNYALDVYTMIKNTRDFI